MARIKVTGYIESEELSDDHVDLSHPTGLTNKGYESLTGINGEPFGYSLKDLEDLATEVVED